MKLNEYKANTFSQNGEDGILKEIMHHISVSLPSEKWCVEFGAWDGQHLSNTFNLVKNGWNAIYIEGDSQRFQDLLNTSRKYSKILPINAFVETHKKNGKDLDEILRHTPLPDDYEVLSIDIDSFDLEIWHNYIGRPKIVIIEINSLIPPGILQWHDGLYASGNSFSATCNVAEKKNYKLVCHTGNLIFVRGDLIDLLPIDEKSISHPETLFDWRWINKKNQTTFEKAQRRVKKIKKIFKK